MTREDLILDCRYFNGEEKVPESIPEHKQLFWFYEECWVRFILNKDEILQESITYYSEVYDLPNLLPDSIDGTPISLKAILFNRYDHWGGFMGGTREEYAQQFKKWFLNEYIADKKTHRQLARINIK